MWSHKLHWYILSPLGMQVLVHVGRVQIDKGMEVSFQKKHWNYIEEFWKNTYTLQKRLKNQSFVTCYEKRDHLGYYIKVEVLAWINICSSLCAESNGASRAQINVQQPDNFRSNIKFDS